MLVRQIKAEGDEPLWQMAEFFILWKYWRQGIGREVAHRVYYQFHGRWEIVQEKENLPAQKFWKKVIGENIQ